MNNLDYQIGCEYLGGGIFRSFNQAMAEEVEKKYKVGDFIVLTDLELEHKEKISWQQHKSIWLYLTKMADTLSGGGIDMLTVFNHMKKKSGFMVAVTKERLKRDVWNEVQLALFSTDSIKKLTKTQVDDVYRHVDGFFQREFNVSHPFPDSYGRSLEDGH